MNAKSIGNEINVTIPLSPSQHRLPSLTSSQLSSLSSQHALLMVLTKGRGQSQDWPSHGGRVGGLAYNIDWIYLCTGRGTHSRRCLCSAGELLIAASWTLAWEKQVRYKRTKRAKKKKKTQELPGNKHCVQYPLSGQGNPEHPVNRGGKQRGQPEALLLCSLESSLAPGGKWSFQLMFSLFPI